MASITASRATVPTNTGAIGLDLRGSGTSWSGSTTFTASGVAGCSVLSKIVTSAGLASIELRTGASTGTLTISDGANSTTIRVARLPAAKRWFPGLSPRS
jgi:hypothetical protein